MPSEKTGWWVLEIVAEHDDLLITADRFGWCWQHDLSHASQWRDGQKLKIPLVGSEPMHPAAEVEQR